MQGVERRLAYQGFHADDPRLWPHAAASRGPLLTADLCLLESGSKVEQGSTSS